MDVLHEFHANDGGLIGSSYDAGARTLVTGGFDGSMHAWQMQVEEVENLGAAPVRRLKEILAERKLPFEDLREKAELVSRIRLFHALPPARKLTTFANQGGSVVSTAHAGDVVVSGSNAGAVNVWNLRTGARTLELNGHSVGVDSVAYDAGAGRAYSGGKDGRIVVWDLATGSMLQRYSCGTAWVWALASNATAGAGAAIASGGTVTDVGRGDLLLAGTTSGMVAAYDTRVGRRVAAVHVGAPETDLHTAMMARLPIAGLAPMFDNGRFVTSSFDGYVRVWDLRTFRVMSAIATAATATSGDRLARVAVYHDLAAAVSMNGTVELVDMDVSRDRVVAAE